MSEAILEVIVCSVADAIEAQKGGVNRLEVVRSHHVHVCAKRHWEISDTLAFRDYLRTHSDRYAYITTPNGS